MSGSLTYLVCASLLLCGFGESAKILGIFPMPAPSHYNLAKAYMRALAEAGHDVTVISPFYEKDLPTNGSYRDLTLTGSLEEHKNLMKEYNPFETTDLYPIIRLPFMFKMGALISEKTIQHEAVQKLLKSNERFDVVVISQFFNDALKAFAHHFDAHLIMMSAVRSNSWTNSLVCNPQPTSYVPEIALNIPSKMSFLQRLENTAFYLAMTFLINVFDYPAQQRIVTEYFPKAPPLSTMVQNVSLLLVNSHESLNPALPNVPQIVNIGGYHITPPKALPKDLQDFLDNAKHGVIYFSLGSNLKSKDLPEEKRNAILQTFSKLKQQVLWKWESDVLPGQPSNVKLSKWLPQPEVLAHPNVKIFITHGGFLSTTEAVYHGKPIIAIPIFGDQKMNANNAELDGYGLVMPFNELSEANLNERLQKMLKDPKYSEVAKLKSKIMHDRQNPPIETAVYWTEYIIRHNGAQHLRVAGLDLPWYQYYLIDVFGVIILSVIFSLYVFIVVVKSLKGFLCKKKSTKTKMH